MPIKKVVIAAAGQGTRMQNLSSDKSKHLIPVDGRPFLAYLIDNLLLAGYRQIILVVGFKSELMNNFVKTYEPPVKLKKDNYSMEIINQTDILGPKEKEYGTACPIKCVKDIIGNENFIYVFGDNLFSVEDLKSINIDDKFSYIAGVEQKNPEKYGVLVSSGEFLEKIIEKPKEFVGNLVNAGLYKFTPEIFKQVEKIEKSPRGEYEITDAISLLAKDKKIKIKKIENYWQDFGSPEDVDKLSEFLKDEDN